MDRKRGLPNALSSKNTQTSTTQRKRPRAWDRQASLESKRPRYTDKEKRSEKTRVDTEHQIDTVYAEYHDKDGHFLYELGGSVGDGVDLADPTRLRYKILGVLGKGTFGLVLEGWDRLEHKYVALKIVRAVKKYTDSARIEIDILTKIQRSVMEVKNSNSKQDEKPEVEQISLNFSGEDSEETQTAQDKEKKKKLKDDIPPQGCIELESWFMFKGHVVMVFKKYGLSLYDFLEQNEFRPFEFKTIIHIAYLLFATLYYLHEGLELIHTDLKPENIIFVHEQTLEKDVPPDRPSLMAKTSAPRRTHPYLVPYGPDIKVIDLGSAVFEYEHHGSIISTRHYRAPEVILQMGWSFPADIWSVGCILVELFLGRSIFLTHSNSEHLAMMKRILGPIDSYLLDYHAMRGERGARAEIMRYFRKEEDEDKVTYGLNFPRLDTTSHSIDTVNSLQPLEKLVDARNYPDFYDLVKKTLIYDPKKRITAEEALEHPFFDSIRVQFQTTLPTPPKEMKEPPKTTTTTTTTTTASAPTSTTTTTTPAAETKSSEQKEKKMPTNEKKEKEDPKKKKPATKEKLSAAPAVVIMNAVATEGASKALATNPTPIPTKTKATDTTSPGLSLSSSISSTVDEADTARSTTPKRKNSTDATGTEAKVATSDTKT